VATIAAVVGWTRRPVVETQSHHALCGDVSVRHRDRQRVFAAHRLARRQNDHHAREHVRPVCASFVDASTSSTCGRLPGPRAPAGPSPHRTTRWIGFLVGNEFRKVPMGGGPSVLIGRDDGNGSSLDWAKNDVIVTGSVAPGRGLAMLPVAGGKWKTITTPDTAAGEWAHAWPRASADGRTILFVSFPRTG
jgi:hypothetical protein